MQIDYDPQSDAIYIRLRDGEISDTLEAGKFVFVDVEEDGVPLGLEILFADRLLDQDIIAALEEAMIDDDPAFHQGILEARAAYEAGDFITLDDYMATLDVTV